MAFFGFFRRKPPIREIKELADFIDEQSAYLTQKGIYDYSQARSGPFAKQFLNEPQFLEALEKSRWQAYPLGLAMIGELVDGVLRPHAGNGAGQILDELTDVVLSVFDRYPVPAPIGKDAWLDTRAELALKLDRIRMHPAKRAIDIPESYSRRYFGLMPFHKDMLTADEPTARGYLRITLANLHEELVKRMDAPAIAELLRKGGDDGAG
jgi:hypothetical protein